MTSAYIYKIMGEMMMGFLNLLNRLICIICIKGLISTIGVKLNSTFLFQPIKKK